MYEYLVDVPLLKADEGEGDADVRVVSKCVNILNNPADYCKRDFASAFYTYCRIAIENRKCPNKADKYPAGILLSIGTEYSLSVVDVKELLNKEEYSVELQRSLDRAVNDYIFSVFVSEIAMALHLMYKEVRNWVDIAETKTIPDKWVDKFRDAVFVVVS